jgi:hypothetical protein
VISVIPPISLNDIAQLQAPVPATLTWEVLLDSERVDAGSIDGTISPVDRVRWTDADGDDIRPFVVTLVMPDEPALDPLLREAINFTSDGALQGYQANPEGVYNDIGAIYTALQNRDVAYSNIPGSFYDGAQRVRLVRDTLAAASANCIDGTLLMASAFESLGLNAYLVFMTGHALVAVETQPGSGTVWYIETTAISSHSFDDAATLGLQRVQSAQSEGDPELLMVSVDTLRDAGLLPFPL